MAKKHLPEKLGRGQRLPYADRININVADRSELTRLYRVGDDLAEEIVEYRREHGPFKAAKQITNVPGIGRDWFENDAGDQIKV